MFEALKDFSHTPIEWDLTPEHAVTMYLEWGNNDWNAQYAPVRSKHDVSIYFVIDTWEQEPKIRLVRRNSEGAEDLVSFPLPAELLPEFKEEFGDLKGIFAPTDPIKDWLKTALDH